MATVGPLLLWTDETGLRNKIREFPRRRLSTCVDDSDWVGDLDDDGFGEFIDIELEGIKYLKYDGDLDELEVYFNNSKIWYIDRDDISDYLVKIEIVNIENKRGVRKDEEHD